MKEQGAIWTQLRDAALVASAAFITGTIYVHYLSAVAFSDQVQSRYQGTPLRAVFERDVGFVALLALISALVGGLFARRYRLAGVRWDGLREFPKWMFLVAAAIGTFGYFAFGRAIAAKIPGAYPLDPVWALSVTLKGAIFDETIARFGMMTVFAGVTKRVWHANVLQAVFFTPLVFKGFGFHGLEVNWDLTFVLSLALVFGRHLLQGGIYARFGLTASMAFHAVIDLRFVAHAFAMTA